MPENKEKPKPMKLSEIVKELAELDVTKADAKAMRDKYLKEGMGMAALSAASGVATYKVAFAAAKTAQEQADALAEYQRTIGTRAIPGAIMAKNGIKHVDYLDTVLESDIEDQEGLTVGIGQLYFNTVSGKTKRR